MSIEFLKNLENIFKANITLSESDSSLKINNCSNEKIEQIIDLIKKELKNKKLKHFASDKMPGLLKLNKSADFKQDINQIQIDTSTFIKYEVEKSIQVSHQNTNPVATSVLSNQNGKNQIAKRIQIGNSYLCMEVGSILDSKVY